jgi:hypothetical protein
MYSCPDNTKIDALGANCARAVAALLLHIGSLCSSVDDRTVSARISARRNKRREGVAQPEGVRHSYGEPWRRCAGGDRLKRGA